MAGRWSKDRKIGGNRSEETRMRGDEEMRMRGDTNA